MYYKILGFLGNLYIDRTLGYLDLAIQDLATCSYYIFDMRFERFFVGVFLQQTKKFKFVQFIYSKKKILLLWEVVLNAIQKSRIRETKHLSTDADSSTNTKKIKQKFSNLRPLISITFSQGF